MWITVDMAAMGFWDANASSSEGLQSTGTSRKSVRIMAFRQDLRPQAPL